MKGTILRKGLLGLLQPICRGNVLYVGMLGEWEVLYLWGGRVPSGPTAYTSSRTILLNHILIQFLLPFSLYVLVPYHLAAKTI
jgi:hypothetical protein